jgi:hypothetical protein
MTTAAPMIRTFIRMPLDVQRRSFSRKPRIPKVIMFIRAMASPRARGMIISR